MNVVEESSLGLSKALCTLILKLELELDGHRELGLSAILDNQMIGSASLRGVNQPAATLYRLYVDPEFRSQGIGSRLVNVAANEAREHGCKAISAIVVGTKLVDWYWTLGFSVAHCEANQVLVSRRLE